MDKPCKYCRPDGGSDWLLKEDVPVSWTDPDTEEQMCELREVEVWLDDTMGHWRIEVDGGVLFGFDVNCCPKCGRRLVKE